MTNKEKIQKEKRGELWRRRKIGKKLTRIDKKEKEKEEKKEQQKQERRMRRRRRRMRKRMRNRGSRWRRKRRKRGGGRGGNRRGKEKEERRWRRRWRRRRRNIRRRKTRRRRKKESNAEGEGIIRQGVTLNMAQKEISMRGRKLRRRLIYLELGESVILSHSELLKLVLVMLFRGLGGQERTFNVIWLSRDCGSSLRGVQRTSNLIFTFFSQYIFVVRPIFLKTIYCRMPEIVR
jgi:hypothetical protein